MSTKKLITIGIVAIAAYLVWRNWDAITAKFRK